MTSPMQRWRMLGQALLGLGLTFLFFYTMAPFMIAMVLGAVIAIICHPIYRRLCQTLPRHISSSIVTLGVTLLILAPLTFVGISAAYRLTAVIGTIQVPTIGSISDIADLPFFVRLLAKIPTWLPIDTNWIQEQGLALAQLVLARSSKLLALFLAELPGLLLAFVIVIISTYFMLVDGKKFARFLSGISPLPPDQSAELFDAFSGTCRGVVLGMFLSSAAQGALITLFFAVTGIPNPVLWGCIGVLIGMVPVIGVAPITLGGIIYQIAMGSTFGIVGTVIGLVVIGTADNVVRPWVLKGQGEMHPLLGLVSAFGAVSVLGPMGVILGPVIAAVFVAFLQILSSDLKPKTPEAKIVVPGS